MLWKKIETEAITKMKPIEFLEIYGSDMDLRAVRVARHNLKVAGLEEVAKVMQSDFIKLEPPGSEGVLVTNPPYGVRLNEIETLIPLYRDIGSTLKHQYKNWTAGIITSEKKLIHSIGLKPEKQFDLRNGGLESRFSIFRMY